MKKSILLISTVLITVTALGFANWKESTQPDKKEKAEKAAKAKVQYVSPLFLPKPVKLNYDFGTRFGPIKKSTVDKATNVLDFFPEDHVARIKTVYSANVIVIIADQQSNIQSAGTGSKLTPAQINLLRSADYSTNIKISAECYAKNGYGKLEDGHFSPHLTIVPEKQAAYIPGKEELIKYLRENNKKNAFGIDAAQLGFAKLYFTVTKNGTVENFKLHKSSGYAEIDNSMIKLIKKLPGKWIPAENVQGEKVDQELVVSFGRGGC